MPKQPKSILDAMLVCLSCGRKCKLRDAIPCVNGGTGFGCPVPDCGGLMRDA
jgi:hypothetical protein